MDNPDADGNLKCNQCGVTDVPVVKEMPHSKGMHITAYCYHCGKYIKHLPKTTVLEAMPFGKYNGMPFAQIADIDPEYLKWLCDTEEISQRIREAAEGALFLIDK